MEKKDLKTTKRGCVNKKIENVMWRFATSRYLCIFKLTPLK